MRLVVISPGWGNSTFYLKVLERNFIKEGYDVAIIPNHPDGIRASATQLIGALQRARETYDHITFIGHSMGGLVGRYAIHKFPTFHNIDSYVSIATPHQGSYLAELPKWSKTAIDMKRDSEFLKEINNSEWPLQIPALAIQANFDEFVIPISSTRLAHAENITIPKTTHLTVAMSNRTFYEIHAWLTSIVNPGDWTNPPMAQGFNVII